MKQSIPPGAFIAIIVVLVIVVGFIGYKVLVPQKGAASSAQDMGKIYASHPGNHTGANAPPGSGGGSPATQLNMGHPSSYGGGMGASGATGNTPTSGGR